MKRIAAGMALCLWIGVCHAQVGKNNPYWIFSGQFVNVDNVNAPAATPVALPGTPGMKQSANNALFSKDGRLLFYLKPLPSTNELFAVDRNGVSYALTGSAFGLPGFWGVAQNELPIIPVPNECNEYFIVYGFQLAPLANNLSYSRIRVNPTTGSLTVLSTDNGFCPLFGGTAIQRIGMAVSRTKTVNGILLRYLYVVGPTGSGPSLAGVLEVNNLVEFQVTATGIGAQVVLNGNQQLISQPNTPIHDSRFFCREADLNDDGTALYWGDIATNGRLRRWLFGGVNQPETYGSSRFGIYSGVEFQENGTQDRLFYSVDGSLDDELGFMDDASSPPNSGRITLSSTSAFNKTHIERGTDGLLYVSDGSTLRGFDGTVTTPTLTGGPSLSISNPLLNGFYSLPDQLDGENYLNSPVLPVCDDVEIYNNVSSNTAGTGTLPRFTEVSNSITASNAIGSSAVNVVAGSQVEFKAQNEIILRPGSGNDNGFRAVAGSEFRAYIDDCRLAATCIVNSHRIALVVEDGSTSEKLELDEALSIEVFPNPTTGRITILSKGLNAELPLKASLYTRDGKLIKNWEWTKPSSEETMMLEGSDTFVLRLEQGENRFTQTIIVQP